MTGKEFAKLQSNMGIDVVETDTMSWVFLKNMYAVATPSVEYSYPTKNDIKQILSHKNIWFCIFVSDKTESNTGEYLFEGDNYEMDAFHSKIRNQIRKSLKNCEIKTPPKQDVIKYGIEINREIMKLHGRNVDYLTEYSLWEKYVNELHDSKDVYTYAAYVEGVFAAYIFFIKVDNKYYIYHPFATRKFSKEAPMNGILYTAINDFIKRDGFVSVTYGLASFFTMSGLDKFKKGMLFSEKPMSRVTVLDKKISFLFNRYGDFLLSKLSFIPKVASFYEGYKILYSSSRLYRDYKDKT